MNAKATSTQPKDPNEKFLVLAIDIPAQPEHPVTKVRVYLVNPGEVFQNFGGNPRHTCVPKKTASLIYRYTGVGISDNEMDIANRSAWESIHWCLEMVVKGKAVLVTSHLPNIDKPI